MLPFFITEHTPVIKTGQVLCLMVPNVVETKLKGKRVSFLNEAGLLKHEPIVVVCIGERDSHLGGLLREIISLDIFGGHFFRDLR